MLESLDSKSIQNKLTFIKGTKIPLPSLVEISNSGLCNRKCTFCPRSDPDYPDIHEFISDKFDNKLCSQLLKVIWFIFVYAGFNEPVTKKSLTMSKKQKVFYQTLELRS